MERDRYMKKITKTSESHKQAVNFYARKLNENPEMPRYNHLLAALKVKEKDLDGAQIYYKAAIENAPDNIMARNDYALFLSKRGNKEGGVREMRAAIDIQTDNATLQNNMEFPLNVSLSRIDLAKGDTRVERLLIKITINHRGDGHIHFHKRGAMLARTGEYKEAYLHAQSAVLLNPFNAQSHRNLAKIHDTRGEVRSSLEHNREALLLEAQQGTPNPNTKCYRTAAIQIISLGDDKEKAYALMERARLIEGKKFECDTSQRTREIMIKLTRRIEDGGTMVREAAAKEKEERNKATDDLRREIEKTIARRK